MNNELNIIFENENLIVINKPAGLVVNNSETIKDLTLQDLIGTHLNLQNGELGIGGRAGIVHRLDRETSGVILVAKDEKSFLNLQNQFKNREVQKEYIALVHGESPKSGSIEEKILRIGKFGKFGVSKNGRESLTYYERIELYQFSEKVFIDFTKRSFVNKGRERYLHKNAKIYSLLRLRPKTGRTHQIRVHLKHIGHPVVSDAIYCPSKLLKFDQLWCPRLFLHAKSIEFKDPVSGKFLSFESDLPNDLGNAILNLERI